MDTTCVVMWTVLCDWRVVQAKVKKKKVKTKRRGGK
jgi:hypothetical protein